MKRITALTILIALAFFQDCCLASGLNSWLAFSSPSQITSMAYGNGTFIGSGSAIRCISHDGSNWTFYTSPPVINSGGVAYGGGMFLAFGTNNQNNANYILQSTNGTTWTTIYTSSNTLSAAAYGNNTWVFVGTNDIVTATATSSNWNWSEFQPGFSPACVTYANGSFVIGAYRLNNYSIFSSSDGITWNYNSDLSGGLSFGSVPFPSTGIAYGKGVFVVTAPQSYAMSGSGDLMVFTSSNLVNWSFPMGYGSLGAGTNNAPITFGGNYFITSLYGNNFTSTNGYTWITVINLSVDFDAIAYGQGTFVAASYYPFTYIYQSGVFATNQNSATTLNISMYSGVTINGTIGGVYQIQSTTNLNSAWQTLTNFTLPFSPYIWVDTSSTLTGQKFYRSVQLQ